MRWLLAFAAVVVIGFILLAAASPSTPSSPGSLPSTSSVDTPLQLLGDMAGYMGHFFAAWARWESEVQYRLTNQSPEAAQAVLGFLLCLRSLLAVLGFFALRMLRRVMSRVGR